MDHESWTAKEEPSTAPRHPAPIVRRRCSDGFTVVECLIGLAISAVLLTAVAVAFNASVVNYEENEQMYQSINVARQALTRMTSQLRTASPHPTAEPHWAVKLVEPDNRCTFHTPANESITYEYRSADKKIYLITNSNGNLYVLCDDVTAASFTKTPTDDGLDCKSVQISLTVRKGDFERTLSAAAVIRRNLAP